MKKFISAITAMIFLAVTITPLASCGDDDDPTPDSGQTPETVKPKITISQGEVTETTITVTFNPDENTAKFKYAIGSVSDETAFTAGTLKGIVEVQGKESKTITFEDLEQETLYTIYAQAESTDGTKSDLTKVTATTAEKLKAQPSVSLEILSLTANRASLKTTPNEECSKYFVVLADEDTYEYYLGRFNNDEVDMMEWMISEEYGREFTEEFTMNWSSYPGYYEFEYWYLILPYDSKGNPGSLIIEKMQSPSYDATKDLSVQLELGTQNRYSTAINVTMQNSTTGYYFGLFMPGILQYSNIEIIQTIYFGDGEEEPEYFDKTGTITYGSIFNPLPNSTELVFCAFAVDEENRLNGDLQTLSFTTAASSGAITPNTQSLNNTDYTQISNRIYEKVVKRQGFNNRYIMNN